MPGSNDNYEAIRYLLKGPAKQAEDLGAELSRLLDEVTMSGTTYSLCLQAEEIDMMRRLTSLLKLSEVEVLRFALVDLHCKLITIPGEDNE